MSILTPLTIVLMTLSAFLMRSAAYLLLKHCTLGLHTQILMETAPGYVLITVIVPYFATSSKADLLALSVSVITATCLPLLAVVIISMVSTAILHALFC